jgi:hypothetical protein
MAENDNPTSLAEALPKEVARVRDEVLPVYLALGSLGMAGVTMMRAELDAASKAMIEGDVVAMLLIYQKLKGWEL